MHSVPHGEFTRTPSPTHRTRPLPEDMYRRPQWVISDEKKRPVDPKTGRPASPTDSATWSTYAEACAMVDTMQAKGRTVGIGFVLTTNDPYVCIDLDKCRNPETGDIEPWALEIVEAIGSYTEISPSETGLHIWIEASIPGDRNRTEQFEVYETGRYMTVTGQLLPGYPNPIRRAQEPFNAVYARLFPAKPTEPRPAGHAPSLTLGTEEIIRKASNADNSAKFRALYAGDTSDYGNDHSRADSALVTILAWWTKDPAQLLEIWRSSGLYRSKTNRKDYAERTISNALELVGSAGYNPTHTSTPGLASPAIVDDPALDSKTPDELRAMVRELTACLDAERTARVAAEERVKQCTTERSHLFGILRNSDLGAARLTGFAIGLDFSARLANGETPTNKGLKAPAKRYAEITGLSENVAASHMRTLNEIGLLTKHVVREQTEREIEGEVIDSETGEIQAKRETVRGLRDANYIEVPEGKVINLIDRLATYQRPDNEGKHGGKRNHRPKCAHHPDAGTVVVHSERVECACCRAILEESDPKRTYYRAETDEVPGGESSGTKMMPVNSVVNPLLSDTKTMSEPEPESASMLTGSIMTPEPPSFTVSADFWYAPNSEPETAPVSLKDLPPLPLPVEQAWLFYIPPSGDDPLTHKRERAS